MGCSMEMSYDTENHNIARKVLWLVGGQGELSKERCRSKINLQNNHYSFEQKKGLGTIMHSFSINNLVD